MIIEFGHGALILAFMVSSFCALLPVWSRLIGGISLQRLCYPLMLLQAMLIAASFAILIHAYAVSDFSVVNVVLNSHTDKPLLYKISGAWGNHEGSMMLWVFILSFYGLFVSFTRSSDPDLTEKALIVLSAVSAGFIAFILFTSNPFIRQYPPALNGEDLNPLLQDIGLAMHPPMLYMGYVGFGMVFSYAVAALWRGEITSEWARIVQPWLLLAWSTLTWGIGLGSWWAYRELGWGGWWFWDPVENVSLLPWLTATALLHSNLALEKRGSFSRWVLLLSILTFAMSLMGTFIVRSGLITSVHAFASDPTRGMFILGYVGTVIGISLVLYATNYRKIERVNFDWRAREGAILINNILLVSFAFTILIAILYPVFLTLMNEPTITVGPPYFNTLFLPFACVLSVFAGIAPLLPWQQVNIATMKRKIIPLFVVLLLTLLVVSLTVAHALLYSLIGLSLCTWMLSGTILHAIKIFRAIAPIQGQGFLARIKRFPPRALGTLLSHTGVAILTGAITISSLHKERFEAPITQNTPIQLGAYKVTIISAEKQRVENYDTRRATFVIRKDGHTIATLSPEIRYYPIRNMQTSEVALSSSIWRDVYMVMGETSDANSTEQKDHVGIRLYITPGMMFLWIGFALIGAGGAISFSVRMIEHQRRLV